MSVVAYEAILGTGYTVKQVRSANYAPNVQVARDRANGNSAAAIVTMMSADPQVTLTTGDVGGAITGLGSSGILWLASDTITLPFMSRAVGGVFASGSSHPQIDATRALAVLQSVTASHGDAAGATASIMAHLLSEDGVTAPVSISANNALAATAFGAMYRLGPTLMNAALLSTVTQVTVNTGLTVEVEAYDGDPYAARAFVGGDVDPTITLTFRDFDALAAIGPLYASLTSLNVHLRKCADGGVTVADASTVHVKISAAGGMSVVEGADAEARSSGQANLTIQAKSLTYAAASAITLP